MKANYDLCNAVVTWVTADNHSPDIGVKMVIVVH